jgi:hypothetical protein
MQLQVEIGGKKAHTHCGIERKQGSAEKKYNFSSEIRANVIRPASSG